MSQTKVKYARMRSGKSVMYFDLRSMASATRAHLEEMAEAEPLVARWQGWRGEGDKPTAKTSVLVRILEVEDEATLSRTVREFLAEPAIQSAITDKSWLEMPAWLAEPAA